MNIIGNAFSLQMVEGNQTVTIENVTVEETRSALVTIDVTEQKGFKGVAERRAGIEPVVSSRFIGVSAIGHADTAAVVSSIIGIEIPMNRINVALKQGDVLYVAQIVGGRLPEGAKTLPEGVKIAFKRVTLVTAQVADDKAQADLARALRQEGIVKGQSAFETIGEKLVNGGKQMSEEDMENAFE